MNAPRTSLMRKRAARLAAVQAIYAENLIETSMIPALMVAQMLQSWADSRTNSTDDLPHSIQPEAALLTKLVEGVQEHRARVDKAIEALILPGWKKSRMSLPLLSVLAVCAAEAIIAPSRSKATLIEEYTEVGAQVITDEELEYAHKAFNLLIDQLRADQPEV